MLKIRDPPLVMQGVAEAFWYPLLRCPRKVSNKNLYFRPPPPHKQISISTHKRFIPPLNNTFHIKNRWKLHFQLYYFSCTIFILTLLSLYTQLMLILISIDAQFLQNVVFSFEKGSNSQNYCFSDSHHLIKGSCNKIWSPYHYPPPPLLTLFGKH